ncbi:MAG: histidine kinase dimerization/phosphoacceptor domain-containing protein [Gaiellales bacterium]
MPTLLGDRASARGAVAAVAARDERARIARDLHDTLAHALSAIVVQVDAADVLVEHDPERARAALLAIRETGRPIHPEQEIPWAGRRGFAACGRALPRCSG